MLPSDPKATDPMILFAFWASLALTVLKIAQFILIALRKPKLQLHLTQEVFFRLAEFGEGLFCNPVLLAWNGPVLISEVRATLSKKDVPEKVFPLKVLAFGEKVKGSGPYADHYFHSRSPIAYLAPAIPQRAVYLCVQQKYQDQSKRQLEDLRKRFFDTKATLLSQAGNRAVTEQEVVTSLVSIVDDAMAKMMDLVQLEPGQYEVVIEVTYCNPAARFFRIHKKTRSKISFVVDTGVRDLLRSSLRETLMQSGSNIILDRNQLVIYPEYQPTAVTEHVA